MTAEEAQSLYAAEKKALAGENESQDSQVLVERLILEHGLGVYSSSPVPEDRPYSVQGRTPGPTPKQRRGYNNKQIRSPHEGQRNAVDATPTSVGQDQAKKGHSNPHYSAATRPSNSSAAPKSSPEVARFTREPSGLLLGNDDRPQLPPSTAPVKGNPRIMSSQSTTQANEGRSYGEFVNPNLESQLPSTQHSSIHEHRTLHEDDTGFVNLVRTQFELPDTAPYEPIDPKEEDDHLESDVDDEVRLTLKSRSLPREQSTSSARSGAPETPAIGQRPFLNGANGQVMQPSQLFGQTQFTSAVKNFASPTSSRPSPDLINLNTISPNALISSPLKDRGLRTSPTAPFVSSPPVYPERSSRPSEEITPSLPRVGLRERNSNETSTVDTPVLQVEALKRRNGPEPIREYQPFRKDTSENDEAVQSSDRGDDQDYDFGEDEKAFRRHQARLKRDRSAKSFSSISLPAVSSSRAKIEVPSTNRGRPSLGRVRTDSEEYLAQCHGKYSTDNDGSQKNVGTGETVEDSQDQAILQKLPEGRKDLPEPPAAIGEGLQDGQQVLSSPMHDTEYKETIPETSPAATLIEAPRLVTDILQQHSSAVSAVEMVSFPTLSSGPDSEQLGRRSQESLPESSLQRTAINEAAKNRKRKANKAPILVTSSPSVVVASQIKATRGSSRMKDVTTPSSSASRSAAPAEPGTRSSALTTLSNTPVATSSTTPHTDNDGEQQTSADDVSSPAADRVIRRGDASLKMKPSPSLLKTKTYSRLRGDAKKESRRISPRSSVSTDELAKSPSSIFSVSSKGDEGALPRKPTRRSIAKQNVVEDLSANSGIFDGMVFAISFQEPQPRKGKGKRLDRTAIERMIRKEGGSVLPDGFSELFEYDALQRSTTNLSASVLSSSLHLLDNETGFAALIADSHSRKVKYMQALALGIPCLAPKWVEACVSKKEVVDWSSYLLCAGPSTLLGDAIRSRNLQSYDASTVTLAEIISGRPKLLDGSKILLVMKKTKNEEARMPYVFLAQVLGASLVRVQTVDEARAMLREKEADDEPFDWVYVNDHLHDAQAALFGVKPTEGATRKRKRQSTAVEDSNDRPPKKIRTLNDELVIQSLILGRLIEEGEMEE